MLVSASLLYKVAREMFSNFAILVHLKFSARNAIMSTPDLGRPTVTIVFYVKQKTVTYGHISTTCTDYSHSVPLCN